MKTVRLIPPKTDWLLMCVSRTRGPGPAVATIYTWECSGSHSDFVFYISYLYFVFVIAYLCTCLLFFWLPICELVFVFVIANLCICILICDFLVVDLYFVFSIANLCICILYLRMLICVFLVCDCDCIFVYLYFVFVIAYLCICICDTAQQLQPCPRMPGIAILYSPPAAAAARIFDKEWPRMHPTHCILYSVFFNFVFSLYDKECIRRTGWSVRALLSKTPQR